MATDRNAVMTYLHPDLFRQLQAFQQQHQLRSLSHSVEVILERYLIEGEDGRGTKGQLRRLRGQPLPSETTTLLLQLSQTCLSLQQEVYQLKLKSQQLSEPSPVQLGAKQPAQPVSPDRLGSKATPIELTTLTDVSNTVSVTATNTTISTESCKRGWTGVALAERLQINSSQLSRKRCKPGFVEWTRAQDPDGIGWEFRSFTYRFHPLVEIREGRQD
jgi:hypothetical protein